MNRPPKIGYVLKRFPRLSETFILNEILELERLGSPLQIYSLINVAVEEPGTPRHRLVEELQAPVAYLPARQPLKKWRVKLGHFHKGGFASQTLKEICGGDVPPDSILLLQSALIGSMARAHGIEHLHAHFGSDAASVAMLASRATGLPFSFTAHAKDIFHETVNRDLLRRKMAEASFVVTVSDFNRRYLSAISTRRIRSPGSGSNPGGGPVAGKERVRAFD
jgi:glycosyl transferase family 4